MITNDPRTVREIAEAAVTTLNKYEWIRGVEYHKVQRRRYFVPTVSSVLTGEDIPDVQIELVHVDGVCAMGAVKVARVGLAEMASRAVDLTDAEQIFMARFNVVHGVPVTTFNDKYAKNKQDVIEAINLVIKKEIEREA